MAQLSVMLQRSFFADWGIVLEVVRQDGWALEHAAEQLQRDAEIRRSAGLPVRQVDTSSNTSFQTTANQLTDVLKEGSSLKALAYLKTM